jgi:hypothetical protein
MLVDVLHQVADSNPNTTTGTAGHYEYQQDEDSGALIRVWVEDVNPTTPGVQLDTIPCEVRGIIDGGIRVAGTTERFTPKGTYEAVDFARMKFPAQIILTRRDRVTRVRSMKRPDQVIWLEEEFDDRPTTFDVLGVTPVTDPFGNHVENMALLQRSEIQEVISA